MSSLCAASRSAAGRPKGRSLLAVSGDPRRRPLAGSETREPAFGVPALWIAPQLEEQAIAAGYSVVDAVTVITTHLGELIRQHAWELLGRAEIKRLMDSLNDSHPKLMEELVPKLLTLGEVGRVLEQLLRERVSIRDLGAILEALLETAPLNKSTEVLVEAARQAHGPAAGAAAARWRRAAASGAAARCGARRRDSCHRLARYRPAPARLDVGSGNAPGAPAGRFFETPYRLPPPPAAPPVLLCPSPARYYVKRWLEPILPRLAVVAAGEIPPEVRLRPVGTVR